MFQTFALDVRHRPCVLAGSSLGPESDAVVGTALRLARAGKGQLHVAHALEPAPLPGGSMGFGFAAPFLAERARADLRAQLERLGATAGELAGIEVEIGPAGAVLAAIANRLRADLIVVAPVAVAALPLQRVGTTVGHLLREGSRPVFVVKGAAHIPPERVLAPIDLSPSAADSLRCGLAMLAGEPGVGRLPELIALNVVDYGRPESQLSAAEEITAFRKECLADYDGVVRRAVREGDTVTEILAEVDRVRPDLVLVGTHGRSGWQRLRLGSVAESVIRRSPISVLAVPPGAAFGSALAEAVGMDLRGAP